MNNFFNEKNFNNFMAAAVGLILIIPVGVANVFLGYMHGESPCTLCGHERFIMVLIGALGIFMLRYGPKIKYIAGVFIISFFGLYAAMRHTANHSWRDIGMGFGDSFFGVHTYTWALFIFWVVILAMAFLMLFIKKDNALGKDILEKATVIKPLNLYTKSIIAVSFVILVSNAFQMIISNGPPPFHGTGDPARFTLEPKRMVQKWDMHHAYENFFGGTMSILGKNSVKVPHVAGANELDTNFDTLFENAPIANPQPMLALKSKKELPFKATGIFGEGNAAGIAYDELSGEFGIATTSAGLYFLDASLEQVTDSVIVDKPNGSDIKYTVDATFLGKGNLIATAYNKIIYGAKKVGAEEMDDFVQWSAFRENSGDIMPSFGGDKPYMTSMRARNAFVLSMAKDPASSYLYMLSIPNKYAPNIILIKYDMKDKMLSEESILTPSDEIVIKDERKLSEYYITSADIKDGKLLALSKSFNTLLVIDLASKMVESAYPLPDVGDAHGLAVKDNSLFILSREDGKDVVFEVESPL